MLPCREPQPVQADSITAAVSTRYAAFTGFIIFTTIPFFALHDSGHIIQDISDGVKRFCSRFFNFPLS